MPGRYKAITIGASAGGLSALSFLLEQLPSDYSIPVIIAQHRAKDQKELLEEVLQYKCKIAIKQVDEKEKIKDGFVYIAPPAYHLLIERDHTFSLSSDEQTFSRPSIDILFESAAEIFKETLVGVILTGANADGSMGIATIRKYGGLTIAQDPREANFPFMPQAAIDNGGITFTWTLKEIRNFLLELHVKAYGNEND